MRRLLRFWYAPALLAVAGGYAGYWRIVHDRAVEIMDDQVAAWRADGYGVSWDARTTGGFPWKVEAVFEGPRIAGAPGEEPWSWSSERLRVSLRPWAFDRITVEPEGRQLAETPAYGALDGEAEHLAVTFKAGATLQSLAIEARRAAVVIHADGRTLAAAESLAGRAERRKGDPSRVHLTLGVVRPEWDGIRDDAPASFTLDADVSEIDALAGEDRLDDAAVARWAQLGGGVEVHDARVGWTDSDIGVRGAVDVNGVGRWNGEVEIRARKPSVAFGHLADLGAVQPRAAAQVGAVADALPKDADDFAHVAFDLRDGEVYLLGVRLGEVPPAY